MMKNDGFSLIELLVVLLLLGIMASIAIPGFSTWLPNYRLKSAARDIYSNMQLAKMGSIKTNANWAIVFDTTAGAHRYLVCSDDGADGNWTTTGDNDTEREVDLAGYKAGVAYGHGNAANDIPGGAFPGDDVDYTNNVAVFNPRGTCAEEGYVYLENSKNTTTYGVGTRTSGVIRLLKWNSSTTNWE